MRHPSSLTNVVYVIVSVAALIVYIKAAPAFLGTFVGYWLAVPVVLATAALFLLAGRWWQQLLWLNLPLALAASYWLYMSRTEPEAAAFISLDVGYWMLAASIIFQTLKLLRRSVGKIT